MPAQQVYESEKIYDPSLDQVWVERTIPVAREFMARRRKKDYCNVIQALIDEAATLQDLS